MFANHPSCPRIRVQYRDDTPSLTHQSFKGECDINNIMKKYAKTGLLAHVNKHQGDYADVTSFEDYQASLNAILSAQAAFSDLPAALRARFSNDPAQFVQFVQDPRNQDEMISLGLATRRLSDEGASADQSAGAATSSKAASRPSKGSKKPLSDTELDRLREVLSEAGE